jgi:DNA-binding transcriptional MerR regulator
MEKRYINIKQASRLLGVSALTLRNWDNNGKFPAGRHPISNYRVYDVKDLEALLIEMELSKGRKRPSKTEIKKLMVKHLKPEDGEIVE